MRTGEFQIERHDGERMPLCVACDWCCGCDEHPVGNPSGWNREAWYRHYADAHSGCEQRTVMAYTRRVEVGSYYTDGRRLGEVTQVSPLGHVQMRDAATGELIGHGIEGFRRHWWLVRASAGARVGAR
jgi:hypothetical protein